MKENSFVVKYRYFFFELLNSDNNKIDTAMRFIPFNFLIPYNEL